MTDKIEVTQADRECARNIRNAWDVSCDTAFEIAAQHRILATRTEATPIAWMYTNKDSYSDVYKERWDIEAMALGGWIETPLFSHPPATDVAALVEAAKAMAEDHMTSTHHHPGYVLVPTVAFEQIRQALAPPHERPE